MIKNILAGYTDLLASKETAQASWVEPYNKKRGEDLHQFVLFMKPELTLPGRGTQLESISELILAELERWDVSIGAVRLMNGAYLEEHRNMDRHYGVLNSIAREGRSAISAQAEAKLVETYGEDIDNGAEVLGAYQFLASVPQFSPLSLSILSDNLGGTKLAGGTYAIRVNLLGKIIIVLNAFHPYQLEPFYNPENVTILFAGYSKSNWSKLRQNLAGATDPRRAVEGSIRNRLLERKDELGLTDVSPGANGIHLSAGPLEGMVEIRRFFSGETETEQLVFEETCFGRFLASKGLDEERIAALADNPTLTKDGTSISAYDLTEELNADEAARLLLDTSLEHHG